MKIYAVRDRLIDYYITPFAAENTKQVLAAMSQAINQKGNLDALAQTPHHFELWQLAEVEEDGHIHAHKELIATCDSLVRANLRETAGEQQGAEIARGPYQGKPRENLVPYELRRASEHINAGTVETATGKREATEQAPTGISRNA